MKKNDKIKNVSDQKVGLALGSGGARGLAHIGVIKVLEKNNIAIDFITGSSIGALIGALYAARKDVKWLEQIAMSSTWKQLANFFLDISLKGGLLDNEELGKFIYEYLGDLRFEDLKVPLGIMTTDFYTGEKVVLREGSLVKAIQASMAVPFFFKPFKLGKRTFVDAALSSPVPVHTCRRLGADIVIAVNLDGSNLLKYPHEEPTMLSAIEHCINISRYYLTYYKMMQADIAVEPDTGITDLIGWNGFMNAKKIISSGEKAMKGEMKELERILSRS